MHAVRDCVIVRLMIFCVLMLMCPYNYTEKKEERNRKNIEWLSVKYYFEEEKNKLFEL